jgi:hypothetical protein
MRGTIVFRSTTNVQSNIGQNYVATDVNELPEAEAVVESIPLKVIVRPDMYSDFYDLFVTGGTHNETKQRYGTIVDYIKSPQGTKDSQYILQFFDLWNEIGKVLSINVYPTEMTVDMTQDVVSFLNSDNLHTYPAVFNLYKRLNTTPEYVLGVVDKFWNLITYTESSVL